MLHPDENCTEKSLEEDLNEIIKSTLEGNNSEEQEGEDDCLEEIEAGSDSVPAISAAIKVSIDNPRTKYRTIGDYHYKRNRMSVCLY